MHDGLLTVMISFVAVPKVRVLKALKVLNPLSILSAEMHAYPKKVRPRNGDEMFVCSIPGYPFFSRSQIAILKKILKRDLGNRTSPCGLHGSYKEGVLTCTNKTKCYSNAANIITRAVKTTFCSMFLKFASCRNWLNSSWNCSMCLN